MPRRANSSVGHASGQYLWKATLSRVICRASSDVAWAYGSVMYRTVRHGKPASMVYKMKPDSQDRKEQFFINDEDDHLIRAAGDFDIEAGITPAASSPTAGISATAGTSVASAESSPTPSISATAGASVVSVASPGPVTKALVFDISEPEEDDDGDNGVEDAAGTSPAGSTGSRNTILEVSLADAEDEGSEDDEGGDDLQHVESDLVQPLSSIFEDTPEIAANEGVPEDITSDSAAQAGNEPDGDAAIAATAASPEDAPENAASVATAASPEDAPEIAANAASTTAKAEVAPAVAAAVIKQVLEVVFPAPLAVTFQ